MSRTAYRRIRDILILTFAGLFFLLAQSSYWINHTVFDKQAFTSIVTPVVTSEQSRQAIAGTIVSKAFADRPVANQLIGDSATKLIAGLLGTDLAGQLTSTIIDKSYSYLTTKDPKPIAIDLTAIKTPIEKLTDLLAAKGQNISVDPGSIPDSITLFDPSGLPDIYGYSVLMLWIGPLCWIVATVLAALYIYLGRKRYANRVYWLGGVVIFVSCIGLLVGPMLTPPITAQVPISGLRGVINQLIYALLGPFTAQMVVAIISTGIILVVFSLRFTIVQGTQWAIHKISGSDRQTKTSPKK